MNSICRRPIPSPEDKQWNDLYSKKLLEKYVQAPEGSSWGRLICTWHEKKFDGTRQTHHYALCVDIAEKGLYIDDRPSKIFVKCLAQLIARPLHTIIKTIYHLSMATIIYEVIQTANGHQTRKECLKKTVKSLIDIVKTPLFGIINIVATIAVLIIGTFDQEQLYPGRKLLGKIEQAAEWGEKHALWTLAECFQPFPLSILKNYEGKKHCDDTFYISEEPLELQLTNFAYSLIQHKRYECCDLFDCQVTDTDSVYVSPFLTSSEASFEDKQKITLEYLLAPS